MQRQEFDQIGKDRGFDFSTITQKDYRIIERVYQFHPCIDEVNGEEQIVDLVGTYGMRIIRDMASTATRARGIELKIAEARDNLDTYLDALEELKRGESE